MRRAAPPPLSGAPGGGAGGGAPRGRGGPPPPPGGPRRPAAAPPAGGRPPPRLPRRDAELVRQRGSRHAASITPSGASPSRLASSLPVPARDEGHRDRWQAAELERGEPRRLARIRAAGVREPEVVAGEDEEHPARVALGDEAVLHPPCGRPRPAPPPEGVRHPRGAAGHPRRRPDGRGGGNPRPEGE